MTGVIDILLVEDEEPHAELIRRAFERKHEYRIRMAVTVGDARRLITNAKPNLILTDLMLPDGRGIELLQPQKQATPPLILLTSHGDETVAVEAMKAGALDYVVKSPETLASMPSIAARALREWGLVQDRRRAEEAMRRMVASLHELHHITSGQRPYEEKLVDVLQMGCNRFDLPVGTLSRIEEDRYEIREAVSLDGTVHRGRVLSLEETICAETVRAGGPIHLKDVRAERRRHVADAPVAAYIGIPVTVGEQLYGTLGFSSFEERAEPFTSSDEELLKLMAQWVGAELWRHSAEEALRESERRFQRAQRLEAIGRLASGVAHDYNNLLMGIGGCVDIALKNTDENSPARLYLVEAKNATSRGSTLTRQLLSFSRKRAGELTHLDLNRVVQSTEKMIRSLVGESVEVRIDLGIDRWRVSADEGQMEQVLMNLVVNARDSMPRGGTLSIATEERTISSEAPRPSSLLPGDYVTLTVSDTGHGMGADTLEQIFEPFFTTKAVGQGTGLGLSTILDIVKENRGHIDVKSMVDQGTTFTIYLPRVAGDDTVSAPREAPASARAGSETILLVEDEPLVRITLRSYLSDLGHRVLEAGDASEALLIAGEHEGKIDLLLTDIMLPGNTGTNLATEICRKQPSLRVIYMSAHSKDALVQSGHVTPRAAVLQKPFDREKLHEELRRALGDK